jgi:hypothetical protein
LTVVVVVVSVVVVCCAKTGNAVDATARLIAVNTVVRRFMECLLVAREGRVREFRCPAQEATGRA